MLEDGLVNYEYDEIWSILNNLGAFITDWKYNPFLDKYPSRAERKKLQYHKKN